MNHPSGALIEDAGWFRASAWQDLLTQAAQAIGAYDAICPFGFELSRDTQWLQRPLNRFYVLMGGDFPPLPQATHIGNQFARNVMQLLLAADPAFANRMAFVRVNRTSNIRLKGKDYVASENDALIGVLTIQDPRGALQAYADYVVSLLAASDFRHGEFAFFHEFPRTRRRLIQLTYMAIWIAEGLGLPLSLPKPPGTYSYLYKTEIRDFYTGEFRKPPNEDEVSFLENVAKPIFTMFRDYLHGRSVERPYSFEVADLFSGRKVSARLGRDDYEQITAYVKDTYLAYREPATGFSAVK